MTPIFQNLTFFRTFFLLLLTPLLLFLATSSWGAATPEEINQWLNNHNQHRIKHQVAPVTWSNTVAASAQAYADTCPTTHSSSGYGENLAWGYPTISSVVTAWYQEESNYDYDNPGYTSGTGHFTQIVWKGTTEIGCALKTGCSRWPTTWICQYNPPGNYLGRFADNVLPPVTDPPPPPPPTPGNTETFLPGILLLLNK